MLWILGAPMVATIFFVSAVVLAALSGRQPISFTVRLTDWTAGWLFFPPIVLVGAWIWSRRKSD